MARVQFKKKCSRCRNNYVLATTRTGYVECFECQKKELYQEIEDPKMKQFFDIPEDFYKKNAFLRSIRINYNRFKNLTERQIEAFEKTVKELEIIQKEQEETKV